MNVANEKDGERRESARASQAQAANGRAKDRRKRGDNPELGKALRSAYQRTIEEDIPPEMLDLLGKLG